MQRRIYIAVTLLLWLSLAGSAMAGPFEDHQRKGNRLYADGDYREALSELYAAYALKPAPHLLYQIGQAQLHLREGRAALEAYRSYLKAMPRLAPAARASVERSMGEARAMIVLDLTPTQPTDEPTRRVAPLARSWWLWTLVGVAAAGVALGTSLGPILSDPRRHSNYREIQF